MNPRHLTLLKMALEYLGDQPGDFARYAGRIKNQVALLQSSGEPITVADWAGMAQILSVEAISRDIGAERIAKTIYPLVDGLGQYATTLSFIPAPVAAGRLLSLTGAKVSPQVRRLISEVIAELQTMFTTREPS